MTDLDTSGSDWEDVPAPGPSAPAAQPPIDPSGSGWEDYDPSAPPPDIPGQGRADAFAAGAVGAIPFAKDVMAATMPTVTRGASYISQMLGGPEFASEYPQDYASAKAQMDARTAGAEHAHPGYALAGSLAGGAALSTLLPAATIPEAMGSGMAYGTALGASQPGSPGERARGAGWGAITGLVGGTAGGVIGRLFQPAAPGTRAAMDAADAQGIALPRAVTGSPTTQSFARGVAATPFGGQISHAVDRAGEQTGEAVGRQAATIGQGDKEGVIVNAVPAIRDWLDQGFTNEAQRIYRPMGGINTSTQLGGMPETRKVAQEIMDQAAGMKGPEAGYTPAVQDVLDAATRPGGLTFAQMNGLKTALGRSANWDSRGDQEGFKRLYGALTDDVRSHAQAVGGNPGLVAFDSANQKFQGLIDRQGAIRKMIGAKPDEGILDAFQSKAFDNVGGQGRGGDLATIGKLKSSIPEPAYNELVSGMVGHLGKTGDTFSAKQFFSDWAKMSPNAKNQVFSTPGTQQVRNNLDEIARVADFLKSAKPGGGGHIGGAVVGAEFAMRALESVIHLDPAKMAGLVGGAVGGRMASNWLASPAGSGMVANMMRSIGAYSRTPSPATRTGMRRTMGRIGAIAGSQFNVPIQASGR